MINRMIYKQQPMNLIHTTKNGTQLWLGDYYAATNVNGLKQKGIRSVLTTAGMLGIVYPKEYQINHKIINAKDLPTYKMTPHFDEVFQFVQDSLKKGHILIHCAAGISRSTTCVIVYLMRAENMAFKQALDYIRSKRPIVCPNDGFQRQLKRYEVVVKQNVGQKKEQRIEQPVHGIKEENKIVLQFLKEQKKESQEDIAKTVYNSNQNSNYKGFLRGKSLHYTKKPNNIVQPQKNMIRKQEQIKYKEPVTAANKITTQFLTFKLQTPKVVTIKK